MSFAKPVVAILLCYVMALPGFAQKPDLNGGSHGVFQWLTNNYITHPLGERQLRGFARASKS